jgi:hypothetical protein
MATITDRIEEAEMLNYGKNIVKLLAQHSLLVPGEEEDLRKMLQA